MKDAKPPRKMSPHHVRDLRAILLQQPPSVYPSPGGATHRPTDDQRRMAMITYACGMSEDGIALALGINPRTLRKHYAEELERAGAFIKSQLITTLVTAGMNGNISAIKYILSVRFPEWRINDAATDNLLDDGPERDDEVVHFYLPENGRDQPEERVDPLEIEGKAEEAA